MAKKQWKHYKNVSFRQLQCKGRKRKIFDIVGPHGLVERNGREDKFVDWCLGSVMVITNICGYESPGDNYRNQIDYICISKH